MEAGHEQVCLAVGVARLAVHPPLPREHLLLSAKCFSAFGGERLLLLLAFFTIFQHFYFFYCSLLLPFQQEALYVFPFFDFILFHSLHVLFLPSVYFSAILLDIIIAIPTVSVVLFSMAVGLLSFQFLHHPTACFLPHILPHIHSFYLYIYRHTSFLLFSVSRANQTTSPLPGTEYHSAHHRQPSTCPVYSSPSLLGLFCSV